MLQSRGTDFPKRQKKERWGIFNDKTNTRCETTYAQRKIATEEPPLNGQLKLLGVGAYITKTRL